MFFLVDVHRVHARNCWRYENPFWEICFFFKWVESTLPVYPPSLLNEEFSTSEKAEQDKPTEPCSGSLLAQRSGEARRYHPTCHENLLQTFHDISMQGIAPGHPGWHIDWIHGIMNVIFVLQNLLGSRIILWQDDLEETRKNPQSDLWIEGCYDSNNMSFQMGGVNKHQLVCCFFRCEPVARWT